MRISTLALLAVTSGCVDDESTSREPIGHHAKTVEVDTVEPPTVIAVRAEGATAWEVPRRTGPSTFELRVDGPYRLTVVCDEVQNGFLLIRQIARTPDDDRTLELPCDTVASPHRVTGAMVQPGEVHLGAAAAGSRAPDWEVELAADAGKHALVAFDDERIAVRRDVRVEGDTVLARPIDLDTDGRAFVPVALRPTNLDGTELVMNAIVSLNVSDTLVFLHTGDLAAARVAPNSVLRSRDVQDVTIAVHGPTVGRTVTREFRAGDPTTFALPSQALGPVVFDDLTVTWSTLPAYDELDLSFDAFSLETFTIAFHLLEASRDYIETTGIASATIDVETLPGFRPEWRIDTTQEYHRFIGVERERANGDIVGSDVSQIVDGLDGTARGQRERLAAMRARAARR